MTPSPNLTNRRFGKLIALSRDDKFLKGRGWVWKCRCDCGKIVHRVSKYLLVSRKNSSCGCGKRKIPSLVNKRFGRLIALYFEGVKTIDSGLRTQKRRFWMCQCDCGSRVSIYETHLSRGVRTSCGCFHTPNLVGKTFGKFTVIKQEPSKLRRNYWLCRCVCGKEEILPTNTLRRRRKSSCGCSKPKNYAKLNEQQVRGIRKLLNLGYTSSHIARMYHLHKGSILNIRNGKCWKNVI